MTDNLYEIQAFARTELSGTFKKITIKRGNLGPDDVEFDIKFCGICHSDVHIVDNIFRNTQFPCVPGHELAGIVTKVGENVSRIKVGDQVGVGCIVDSCLGCSACDTGDEHICENGGMSMTYNNNIIHGHLATDTGYTLGGYSEKYTLHQRFVCVIPKEFPLEKAGPVFCAGVTMYSPLKHWGAINGGMKVGIVGIGGLGQMGVKLAKAMGCEVTAISTSPRKKNTAMEIGADNFVVSTDPESTKAAKFSLDLILNTVSAQHELATYIPLLRRDGTLVQLGLVMTNHQVQQWPIMAKRVRISGSVIGGMIDTQEAIDFCHKHNIRPEVELITAEKLDEVYQVLDGKNDSIKRYVLDITRSFAECN